MSERGGQLEAHVVGTAIGHPELGDLIQRFLFGQLNPDDARLPHELQPRELPLFSDKIKTFSSAVARFYSPSDFSGLYGMKDEWIHATKQWRNQGPRYDTVFLRHDLDLPGMPGLRIARIRRLFSFRHHGKEYPCALIEHFSTHGDGPDPDTDMWIVTPDFDHGRRSTSIIHIDMIHRAAHLMPVFGQDFEPVGVSRTVTLDRFRAYYVTKFIDHHAHKMLS